MLSVACLFSTLNAVQSKLSHLQAENAISRRRVRELEAELQGCKQQAARRKDAEETRDLDIEDQGIHTFHDHVCGTNLMNSFRRPHHYASHTFDEVDKGIILPSSNFD
jgi:hypothetical protein